MLFLKIFVFLAAGLFSSSGWVIIRLMKESGSEGKIEPNNGVFLYLFTSEISYYFIDVQDIGLFHVLVRVQAGAVGA